MSADDKAELEARMAKVRTALAENDAEAINAEVKSLRELSWKVSQQAYSQVWRHAEERQGNRMEGHRQSEREERQAEAKRKI